MYCAPDSYKNYATGDDIPSLSADQKKAFVDAGVSFINTFETSKDYRKSIEAAKIAAFAVYAKDDPFASMFPFREEVGAACAESS